MDPRYRRLFNRHYSDRLYDSMCRLMDERLETPRFEFRLAETPLMLPSGLKERCEQVSAEVLSIIRRPEVLRACAEAVPARWDTPRPDALPHFLAIDLGIVRGEDGTLQPRLIELQGFSSLYGMQLVQSEIWSEVLASIPGMPPRWTALFSGLDRAAYLDLLRSTVIAGEDPERVILLDLHPDRQKTRPDFHATARLLGVRAVCVTGLRREGRRLFAPSRSGRGPMIPVSRVLHRVVFDELERAGTPMCFDYRDDLDVTWVSHPNWYWIWSKYTLPFIEHPAAPRAVRLDRAGPLPSDLSRFILKPIFSFAGQGVKVDLDRAALDAIPGPERAGWILQQKVEYAPALVAPDGAGVKAEIRMMYLRPEGSPDLTLAINLCRLSRGKMHGVDHNKGLSWVGSSVAIWPGDDPATPSR
ncbi:MAG TPA: hypothetical protein VJV23_03785 [Candidatus Polarisedimenticolia bacterium]|nr:hypothetical protein [Candidatus Polarisedimenticolia bacterium]